MWEKANVYISETALLEGSIRPNLPKKWPLYP